MASRLERSVFWESIKKYDEEVLESARLDVITDKYCADFFLKGVFGDLASIKEFLKADWDSIASGNSSVSLDELAQDLFEDTNLSVSHFLMHDLQ